MSDVKPTLRTAPSQPAPSQPAADADRLLPGGLVLRTARPADLDQIAALLVERGEPDDAVDHALVVHDPDLGWDACAVVVDGDRVVSTATLLDETVRVGQVTLPAGQVELVATHEAYEGRGLVRALMGWAHERSAARGHVLQLMIGIPYFYRLFGYEYAIDIPAARRLERPPRPSAVTSGGVPTATLRRAEARDVPALLALQDQAQSVVDVASPHPPARQRWLLEHASSTTWVLEQDDVVVAGARVREPAGTALVAEATAADRSSAEALLEALVATVPHELTIVHRARTEPAQAWEHRLGPVADTATQYYVRLPHPEVVLDALRPVLSRRLAESRLDVLGGDAVVSTFGRHYRMAVDDDGGLGPVRVGGVMQWVDDRGIAVAPDALGALLLGPHGARGLARRRPDLIIGDEALAGVLFPPLTADVLSYYLPW